MLPEVSRFLPYLLFFSGGATALSWQVLWQLDISLSLGVSAKGAALTVATVMAGLTIGARLMAGRIEKNPSRNPWKLYGILELFVGLLAFLPRLLQAAIERIDSAVFQTFPVAATPLTLLMLCIVIGPSAIAMGATLPVIGIISTRTKSAFSRFYAVNTAGAGFGCLFVTFLLLPELGRAGASLFLVGIQSIVCLVCFLLSKDEGKFSLAKQNETLPTTISPKLAVTLAAVTGFVSFVLEVVWFRLLRASWLSTTDSFAIMLFVFLVALAVGAWLSRRVRNAGFSICAILFTGALLILVATPVLERFDLWGSAGGSYTKRVLIRVFAALGVIGPPVMVIGMILPRLLDELGKPRDWARVYGWNTIGAVAGSLAAGWVLLGWLGPFYTSSAVALLLAATSVTLAAGRKNKIVLAAVACIAGLVVIPAQSGIGSSRVQGPTSMLRKGTHLPVAHVNGPDVTTSVVEVEKGARVLFIDGYAATGEFGANTAYMDAMGRLPMLLHNNPKSALVICFGTGQTTNAVRQENPDFVTVVDVNPAVFELADHFHSNEKVLEDPRVRKQIMDGRAWLRRSSETYDVVTLEPMPPFFAGSNSLYSVEFYELIKSKMNDNGFAAQWFPLHLLSPEHAKGVAAAFCKVFPQSILWIDPQHYSGMQGILLGRKGDEMWDRWPGLDRAIDQPRPLDRLRIDGSIFLTAEELAAFVKAARPVTDDNQMLSYGNKGIHRFDLGKRNFTAENMEIFRELKKSLTSDKE
ncbi:MAG: fused MFS/spermidine synthase [Verrucomicrobiales bacterium]|nr:fused MFS/spermidine synthase [Verrucomicrobiales bacterium]